MIGKDAAQEPATSSFLGLKLVRDVPCEGMYAFACISQAKFTESFPAPGACNTGHCPIRPSALFYPKIDFHPAGFAYDGVQFFRSVPP
jgi:hypothetical protein